MSPRRFRPNKADLQAENLRLKAQLAERDHIEPRPSPDELLRIVEGGSDGCLLLNDDLTIAYMNQGAERLFAVAADTAIGKPLTILLPGDVIAQHAAQMRQLRNASRPVGPRRLSVRAAIPGGESLRLECTFAARRFTGSSGWILLVRNMAAMQAVLESLDAVEQRYQALAEVVPVAIFRTDAQGRCLYASRRWSELTGLTMIEALGDGWRAVIHPGDQERVFREWEGWSPNGSPFRTEYRVRRADGALLWVLAQVVPERDSTGRLLGFVSALTDITPEKQLEGALRAAEEQFRAIFRQNPFYMYVYDRETLFFLDVNDKAVARYGWSREEFLRRKITDITPPEDIPRLLEMTRTRPAEGWYRAPLRWRHRLRDGSIVLVEVTSHPMMFNGRDAMLVAIRHLDPVTLTTPKE